MLNVSVSNSSSNHQMHDRFGRNFIDPRHQVLNEDTQKLSHSGLRIDATINIMQSKELLIC